jgi:hypothetical protein
MPGPTLAPTLAKVVAFGLFLVLGFAAIPLMLRVFLWGQRRIGNEAADRRGDREGRFMLALSIFERTASSTYPRLDFTAP